MCTFTLLLLMFYDIASSYKVSTIYTLHRNKCTYSFMLFNLTLQTFCAALFIRFTLHSMIQTLLVMISYFQIIKNLLASHDIISAFKLHLHKFLFNIFFHAYEARFCTLHRAASSFLMKFFQAFIVKTCFATSTFDRVN